MCICMCMPCSQEMLAERDPAILSLLEARRKMSASKLDTDGGPATPAQLEVLGGGSEASPQASPQPPPQVSADAKAAAHGAGVAAAKHWRSMQHSSRIFGDH